MQKEINSKQLIKLISKNLKRIPDEWGIPSRILKPKIDIIMKSTEFSKFVKEMSKNHRILQPRDGVIVFQFRIFTEDEANQHMYLYEATIYYEKTTDYVKIEKIQLYKDFW